MILRRTLLRGCQRWAIGLSLVASLLSVTSTPSAEPDRPITNCVDILNLSPADADHNYRVKIRGTITCYIPSSQLCFVQDETAGVYMSPSPWPQRLNFGDVVEAEGITGAGRFSPVVHFASLKPTGERMELEPLRVSIEELNTGRFDCQWVELQGVVQTISFYNGVASVELVAGGSSASILAYGFPANPTDLVDATVRFSGVGGTFYRNDRLSGFGLFVSSTNHVQVIQPAPDPFQAPLRSADSLPWYSREGGLDHRIRVRGLVTVAWPGEALFINGGSGSIRVRPLENADRDIVAGDFVEASGFVEDLLTVPRLDHALIRKSGSQSIPNAPFLRGRELGSRPPSGEYISFEATVSAIRANEAGLSILEVDTGNQIVVALSQWQPGGEVKPGAIVRLTGAWSLPPANLQNRFGPVLWLNSKEAISLISQATPFNGSGPPGGARIWIVAALATVGLAIYLAWRAERKVLRLVAKLQTESYRITEAERELQRLHDGRERLGRDLHDRIIQSIYAIGLNLEYCAQAPPSESAGLNTRLERALKDINGVIGELRNLILGLETNAIRPAEFRTALKSLALALGHEKSNRIRLDIAEDALAAMTPTQATELVHIAREALSNSVRHGAAETTSFGLELRESGIIFSIQDDGCGFAQGEVERNGFGLRNMAKRAEHLGANFSIHSEPGRGTRVTLDIPRQKQHFSNHETRPGIDR